jgi:hypothetical protein
MHLSPPKEAAQFLEIFSSKFLYLVTTAKNGVMGLRGTKEGGRPQTKSERGR